MPPDGLTVRSFPRFSWNIASIPVRFNYEDSHGSYSPQILTNISALDYRPLKKNPSSTFQANLPFNDLSSISVSESLKNIHVP